MIVSPHKLSHSNVNQLINKYSTWINNQLRIIEEHRNRNINSNEIVILGKSYNLVWKDNSDKNVCISNDTITINAPKYAQEKVLLKWLKNKSKEYLTNQTSSIAKLHNFNYNRITIRDQKSRWGSCSNRGNLSLNWRLILTPPEVCDYVIIHELVHTRYLNHSKKFWSCVKELCPDYKNHKKWLKENGSRLRMLTFSP